MTERSLLGRSGELAQADAAINAAGDGPSAVTLAGDAGIGKSTIWLAAVDAAAARPDRAVLAARAAEPEVDLAYVVLTDLLAAAVRDRDLLRDLPAPQASALSAALLLDDAPVTDTATRSADPRTIGTAVAAVLGTLADDRPLIVAIDDVQWVDAASLDALTFALRRLVDRRAKIGLVTTVRTPHADRLASSFGAGASAVEVGPVSLGVLHQLLRARLGLVLTRPQVVSLEAASGGNPLLALEIGRELARLDRWPLPGEPLPIPRDLGDLIAERLGRLGPDDLDALFVAAASSDPTTPAIATVVDRPVRDLEEAAARLGSDGSALIHPDDEGRWRFDHPLIAAAALSAPPPDRRRELHARLSDAATLPEDRGRHAALAADGPDAAAADLVDAAARSARARGAPAIAAAWSEVAADLTPTADPSGVAQAAGRRVRAARWFGEHGAIDRGRALVDRAIRDLQPGDQRADALELAAQMAGWVGGDAAAAPIAREALADASDPFVRARALLRLATMSDTIGNEAARTMAEEAVRILEPTSAAADDPDLLACALLQRANLRFEAGLGSDDDGVERALALLGPAPRQGADGDERTESLRAHQECYVWAVNQDDLADGLRLVTAELARARERGHDRALPVGEGEAALIAAWAGDATLAQAHATAAAEAVTLNDHPEARSVAALTTSLAALVRGDLATATEASTRALAAYGQHGWVAIRHRTCLGAAALAGGDPVTAVAWLGPVMDESVAGGRRESLDGRFAGDLVEAAVAAGDLERARSTVELLEGSVELMPRPWVRVMAARGRALLLAAVGDLDGAVAAIDVALRAGVDLPMPVERARTELIAGRIARRRKAKRRATDHLERAIGGAQGRRVDGLAAHRRGRAGAGRSTAGPGRRGPDRDRGPGRAVGRSRPDESGGRRGGVPHGEERRGRTRAGLPEARDPVARGARGVARRPGCRGTHRESPVSSGGRWSVASRAFGPACLEVFAMLRRHPRSIPSAAASALVVALAVAACGGSTSSGPSSAGASPSLAVSGASSGTELVTDIDIDGRSMHLVCIGPASDAPTVILEAGLGAPYTAWGEQLLTATSEHRLCAYDRAGIGMSDAPSEPSRTSADLVADLRALLDEAGVAPPYVVASHSFGAWPAALFAATYPDDVVGALFVDPRGPRVSGDWRSALPAETADEPSSVAANREELGAFETDPSLNDEHLDLTASAAEVIAALDADGTLFGDRPVVVLSAAGTPSSWSDLPPDLASTFDAIWLAGQQEFADESAAGSLVTVPDVGHEIQLEQPPVVNDAITDLLAQITGG